MQQNFKGENYLNKHKNAKTCDRIKRCSTCHAEITPQNKKKISHTCGKNSATLVKRKKTLDMTGRCTRAKFHRTTMNHNLLKIIIFFLYSTILKRDRRKKIGDK